METLGDRWSLVVIRDIMFGNRRHFRELLNQSLEGIAPNILSDRVRRLTELGLLSRADDPTHRQKTIYSLTEKAIDLVPLIVQLGAWGRKYLPTTSALAIRAQVLEEGGPRLWDDFMAELRHAHLGAPLPARHRSVARRLEAAYRRVAEEEGKEAEEGGNRARSN